jgi:hypothetical protein
MQQVRLHAATFFVSSQPVAMVSGLSGVFAGGHCLKRTARSRLRAMYLLKRRSNGDRQLPDHERGMFA